MITKKKKLVLSIIFTVLCSAAIATSVAGVLDRVGGVVGTVLFGAAAIVFFILFAVDKSSMNTANSNGGLKSFIGYVPKFAEHTIEAVLREIDRMNTVYKLPQDGGFDKRRTKELFPYMPDDYIEFLSRYKVVDVYGEVRDDPNTDCTDTDEELSEWLEMLFPDKKYTLDDWHIIGWDEAGGAYAFRTAEKDSRVYYLEAENFLENEMFIYDSFTEFLIEQLSFAQVSD